MSIERSGVRTWIVPWRVVPVARHAAQRRLVVGRPPALDQVGRRRGPVRLAEQDEDLGPRSAGELEAGLQCGARVEAGTGGSLQPGPAVQARRPLRSAVAAEELGPIGRPRRLPPAEVEEGDPAAELGVPWVAHEERPGLRVECRDDPRGAGPARGAQRPLGIGGHRQAPASARIGSRSSAPRSSAGRRAGRTGRGRARCRRAGARTGCSPARDGRRTSTPRSGSAGPSDPTARRCRRPGRRSPRSTGSLTGSLDHGVSWFSRLFPDHVYPDPDSETWNPNDALAMTLSQGAGVACPGPRMVTYSRPPSTKPPSPLKNSSSGRGATGSLLGWLERAALPAERSSRDAPGG